MCLALRHFLICLAALAGAISVAPAMAQNLPFSASARCAALAPEGTAAESLLRDSSAWDCSGANWPIAGKQASFVRIDMNGQIAPPHAVLSTRLTRFRDLTITAIGVDGTVAHKQIKPSDLEFATTGWTMFMPAPQISGPVAAYVIKVTGARHRGMLSDFAVGPLPTPPAASGDELLLAGLCGLMIMPLVLNFAIFRVLRQPFALWHALAVFAMLVQTLVAGGLINRFIALDIVELTTLSVASWALVIIAATRFFTALLEPGILSRRHKALLNAMGPWIVYWSLYYLLADGILLSSVAVVYYMAFLPVIGALTASMVIAAMRGSRTVRFQIVGWAPLMIMGIVRIASLAVTKDAPMGLMGEQHLAVAFEVLVTSLGAADRFMAIKDQRDKALAHSRILEALAARDPLTGLYNRRGFEERFEELSREGFDTMAVVDLDHFKTINDTRGHACGDAVLQSVARTLAPDEDTVAVRMGGEEFVLLLRGPDAAQRAERRRLTIPNRIAVEVPGLEKLVTASMGIVRFAPSARFSDLYRQCDRLLYAAKSGGRNRTESNIAERSLQATDPAHQRAQVS